MSISITLVVIAALLLVPAVAPPYLVHIAIFIAIYTLPVIGLGFLTGFTNRISLAQGAIFGIGAYVTALLTTQFGWSPMATFIPSILGAVLIATVLGAPAMRLAGLYFVMATIAIQQIVWIILMNWIDLTHGPQGVRSIPPLAIGSLKLDTPYTYYYAAFVAALVSFVLARRTLASRLGLQMRALSEDELASAMSGVQVFRAKVMALVLSAAWAGAGGFLYAHYMRFIHPDMFTLEPSILFLTMAMFGGYRSLIGMVIATAVLESATEYLRPFGEFRMIAYGLILMIGMMFFPKGILTVVPAWNRWFGATRSATREA
jgi:branched-chain amino acid transport system permease protein